MPFVGALFLAAAASGQSLLPSGNLYGSVADEQGRRLPGVQVTVRGPGVTQIARSDSSGDFHFLSLPPATYSVTLERMGFATARDDVSIALGQNAAIAFTMGVATQAEGVTVSAQSFPDNRETKTGATFGQAELRQLPTTRDPWALLRMVPGVLVDNVNVGGQESATQSVFVGKGSHPDQNTYSLDGVAITDMNATGSTPIYFDFDSLDSVEIVTGGSDPTLATPGVAVNLVTKRGTNELRGSGRYLYTEDTRDYGLEVGGPILADRVWLWAAGARNEVTTNTTTLSTGGTATSRAILEHWNAKMNAQPLAANSMTLFYLHFDKPITGRQASADRPPETTLDQSYPTSVYKIEDDQVFSENLFASIDFSYLNNTFKLTPEGGLARQADVDVDGVWHNSYAFYQSRSPQHQARLTGSAFFDTGRLKHELKFGFGYKHTITDSLSAWPGDGLIGFEASSLAAITRSSSLKFEMNYYDAFLADTISAGGLTVSAGLRFDYQQGRNLPSAVPANPVYPELLPAVTYSGDSSYPITWREVEPRVSVTWSPGRDRKTLLRASYSRFASQLGSEVGLINPFPGPQYLYSQWNDANSDHHVDRGEVDTAHLIFASNVDPLHPGLPLPVNRIAPNLVPPRTDEIIVGIDRELLPDLSASISATYRSARDLEFRPLVGATASDYRYLGNATGVATDSHGFVLGFDEPYYGLTTDPPPAGIEVRNRADYRETYGGLEMQFFKRLSHGWMLRGSVAFNDWKKRVGSAAIIDPNNLQGGSNADGGPVVQPSGNNYKHGVFINARWQFNVSGMVQLPLGIELGANVFGREGYVIPYSVRVITHDTGFSRPLVQIGRVDAYRLPNVYEFDLRFERPFRVGSRLTASPSIDLFNVPNRRTVLQRISQVGTYDAGADPTFTQNIFFNAVDEIQRPRTFRAGVRVSF